MFNRITSLKDTLLTASRAASVFGLFGGMREGHRFHITDYLFEAELIKRLVQNQRNMQDYDFGMGLMIGANGALFVRLLLTNFGFNPVTAVLLASEVVSTGTWLLGKFIEYHEEQQEALQHRPGGVFRMMERI